MPGTTIICPDGKSCEITQCLSECRIKNTLVSGRCMSLPSLISVTKERPWTGVPSTTMLLNGVRETFLKITKDYPIDPQNQVFAVYGTAVHSQLEGMEVPDALKEERLFDDYSSGAYDYLDTKTNSLWDFKTYGSFKAAKVLGIRKNRIPVGTFKNGNTKYKTFYTEDGHKDRLDLSIQLNDYRTKLQLHGTPVDNMYCEMLCRDGNTQVAKNRGLFKSTYIVQLNKISDKWLERWKRIKHTALMSAIMANEIPAPCRPRERWAYFSDKDNRWINNKCQKYCQPWMHCNIGRAEHDTESEED